MLERTRDEAILTFLEKDRVRLSEIIHLSADEKIKADAEAELRKADAEILAAQPQN